MTTVAELVDFIKFLKEVHCDEYGHLQVCENGDELDPTYERVAKEYLKQNEKDWFEKPNDDMCPLCHNTGEYSYGGSFGGSVHTQKCDCGKGTSKNILLR